MKVKIINARHSVYWYAKHIGEVFEVEQKKNRHGETEYILLPTRPDGDFFINADDCEVVEEG